MESAIVLMSKVPRAGYTKTRLLTHLSGAECAEFHSSCLQDLAYTLEQTGLKTYLYYTAGSLEQVLFDNAISKLEKRPQIGQDLGERLYNAALEVLSQHGGVIFIGADLPYLSCANFIEAVEQLARFDTVIGPAEDGGYYLFGIKQAKPGFFSKIDWGTDRVMSTTLVRIKSLGLSVSLLETKRDIDTWDDVLAFNRQNLSSNQYRELKSYRYIEKIAQGKVSNRSLG